MATHRVIPRHRARAGAVPAMKAVAGTAIRKATRRHPAKVGMTVAAADAQVAVATTMMIAAAAVADVAMAAGPVTLKAIAGPLVKAGATVDRSRTGRRASAFRFNTLSEETMLKSLSIIGALVLTSSAALAQAGSAAGSGQTSGSMSQSNGSTTAGAGMSTNDSSSTSDGSTASGRHHRSSSRKHRSGSNGSSQSGSMSGSANGEGGTQR